VIDSLLLHWAASRWALLQLFLRATAVPAGTAERVVAMEIMSVCLSRPSTESSPGEIETPGFHRMIA